MKPLNEIYESSAMKKFKKKIMKRNKELMKQSYSDNHNDSLVDKPIKVK